jgi:hypothetical protein
MIIFYEQNSLSPARVLLAILLVAVPLTGALSSTAAASEKPTLLGGWQIDDALTAEVQPVEGHKKSRFEGFGTPSISVNGMPLPGVGGGSQAATGSPRDPKVLRCSAMTIESLGDNVHLTYIGTGSETLTPGTVQGVKTRWRERSLTSSYETTSRKVSKRFELQKDDTLLVTVKLKPRSGPSVTHKRVFRRSEPGLVSAP